MHELFEKVRVQDAVLANMVSIAAVLEYLDQQNPGAREVIELRAREMAAQLKNTSPQDNQPGEENLEQEA